jgi:hypothetical protein
LLGITEKIPCVKTMKKMMLPSQLPNDKN